MFALKQWGKEVRDCGSRELGDLGLYHRQMAQCTRYDGKTRWIVHEGRTLAECRKFREEFTREGCFCWIGSELCFGVPMCPLHPYGGIGEIDMEMRRTRTKIDGEEMLVFYTAKFNGGNEELIARIRPDCSIDYCGLLRAYVNRRA
jgi:hypothetical protein